jgi:ATP-binding cassette subfamily F protein 3
MRAKDVLLEAIAAFSGTVIFVSHDRYFIDRLASRVLEVENGTVITYEGNYEDYLRKKEELALSTGTASPVSESRPFDRLRAVSGAPASIKVCHPERSEGPASDLVPLTPSSNGTSGPHPTSDRPKRLNPIKQKQMEDRCAFLEEEVPRIESAIAHTEQQLGVYVSAEETQRLTHLARELRAQLAALTAEWEGLMMQLEEH